jgi:hypothetical protein
VNAWDDDDDATLIVVSDGEANEIDSEGSISYARFDGSNVLYSVSDGDEDTNDGTEVRSAPADGSGKPETVWEDVEIVGFSETISAPFSTYAGPEGSPYWLDGPQQCGEYTDLSRDSASGDIDESGVFYCIVVPETGANVIITVTSDIDTVLSVYDEFDEEVEYSDDGDDEDDESFDPYIDAFLDEGVYTLELYPYEDESGTYDISVEIDD